MALTFQQQLLVCASAVCQASKASNAPRQLPRPNLPAGLSKATLQPSVFQGVEALFARRQTLQTLPQAFPRQLSHLRAFKTAVCPPSNPSNPPAGLPQAFPRQLSQLHAPAICFSGRWSSLCPPSNASNPSFQPFRRPFQGNSRSYTPQPSVFKGVQDCRLPAFKPLKPSRRPAAGLSKATLAATRPSHLFFRALKLSLPAVKRFKPFLQTLPQAFPRQPWQLHAPAICF